MRASFIDVGKTRTRYLHHGAGTQAIMFLHGVGVSADSWCQNLTAFGNDCFAIAPDLLASGFTGWGTFRDGPPHRHMVDHLKALLDRLGIGTLTVVGSSFGALIATLLHLEQPDRVLRLVLTGCAPVLNAGQSRSTSLQGSLANGRAALRDPTLESCRQRMNNLVFDPKSVPDSLLWMQLTLFAWPEALDMYEARMRGIIEASAAGLFTVFDRLEEISVPTLVIWGRQDPRGRLDEASEAAKRLPKGRWEIFEACGHLPYLERPAQFNEAVQRFLAEPTSTVSARPSCVTSGQ